MTEVGGKRILEGNRGEFKVSGAKLALDMWHATLTSFNRQRHFFLANFIKYSSGAVFLWSRALVALVCRMKGNFVGEGRWKEGCLWSTPFFISPPVDISHAQVPAALGDCHGSSTLY